MKITLALVDALITGRTVAVSVWQVPGTVHHASKGLIFPNGISHTYLSSTAHLFLDSIILLPDFVSLPGTNMSFVDPRIPYVPTNSPFSRSISARIPAPP